MEKVQEARRKQLKQPLDFERALRQQKKNSKDYSAGDPDAVRRNYEGARKTIDEQRKRPMDLEKELKLQRYNSQDHPPADQKP